MFNINIAVTSTTLHLASTVETTLCDLRQLLMDCLTFYFFKYALTFHCDLMSHNIRQSNYDHFDSLPVIKLSETIPNNPLEEHKITNTSA